MYEAASHSDIFCFTEYLLQKQPHVIPSGCPNLVPSLAGQNFSPDHGAGINKLLWHSIVLVGYEGF